MRGVSKGEAAGGASSFETREDALLRMRVGPRLPGYKIPA